MWPPISPLAADGSPLSPIFLRVYLRAAANDRDVDERGFVGREALSDGGGDFVGVNDGASQFAELAGDRALAGSDSADDPYDGFFLVYRAHRVEL